MAPSGTGMDWSGFPGPTGTCHNQLCGAPSDTVTAESARSRRGRQSKSGFTHELVCPGSVHYQKRGDEPLGRGVPRKAQPLQRVAAQQGWGVVIANATCVTSLSPSIVAQALQMSMRRPSARTNSRFPVGSIPRSRRTRPGSAGVDGRLDVDRMLSVHAGDAQRPAEDPPIAPPGQCGQSAETILSDESVASGIRPASVMPDGG